MPRRKKIVEQPIQEEYKTEDFLVINTSADTEKKENEETVVSVDAIIARQMERAMREYNFDNKISSVILDNSGSITDPTTEFISRLAEYPQDDLEKTRQIISVISKMVNLDDIIGKTVESIRVNINTDFRLSYKTQQGRNKNKKLEEAKKLIDDFNEEIKIRRIIRDKVPDAYQDGTVIMYLRKDAETGWIVDVYPLGVAIIAPYTVGGDPVVLIDMVELKSRLQKVGFKTRAGKNMFFPTIDEEIRQNYPEPVYEAFKNKDPYAKLDVKYTGVARIGNRGKRYGLSPIFRSLSSALILQAFYRSDELNSKARSKKILWQSLKKETLGPQFDRNPANEMAFAHSELLKAYKQKGSVVYTAPAWVEALGYAEPKSDLIDTKTVAYHLNREMSTLGIGFLSMEGANQSVSTATISLEQLMKTINSVTEQFEEIFRKWYMQILIDEENDPSYAPDIKILDSEALAFELKKELATTLYTIFNLSMKTSLEILGIDLEDEKAKRKAENDDKLEQLFFVRSTAYTSSGNGKVDPPGNGRPQSKTPTEKNQYDQNYNQNARPDA